jgi:hypothetical protein
MRRKSFGTGGTVDKLSLEFERFEVVLKSPSGDKYRFPLTVDETVDLAEHEIMREQRGGVNFCAKCYGTGCEISENCGGIDGNCPDKECAKQCSCVVSD